MIYSTLGNPIYQNSDIFKLLYQGITDLSSLVIEDSIEIKKLIEHGDVALEIYKDNPISIEDYDKSMQSQLFMPVEYHDFDIYEYCHVKSKSEIEQIRCLEELKLYEELNLIPILKLLKYIVDTLRKDNVIWGVGRGSSVSSYVLYKLGVHKIDSLKYELDYHEFFKKGKINEQNI